MADKKAMTPPIPRPAGSFENDVSGSLVAIDPRLRISADTFDRLSQFITSELGIKMGDSKVSMIQSRVLRRVRDLGLDSIDDYCQHLFSFGGSAIERAHFINAITTNKTDFFREPQHFKYLTESVLPDLTGPGKVARHRSLAVWSAACSTGEEPYTLAMVLSEYAATHQPFDFRILATDVSTRVLQVAIDGIYPRALIEPVPADLRRKYLLQGKDQAGLKGPSVRINPALRKKVSFHELNFMDEDYGVREMFDIIFCRNVLIYFDRPTQQAVIGKLCRNLLPHGYLFISHSESLSGLDLPLTSLGSACYRKHGE